MKGQITILRNVFLRPDDIFFQADGITETEHATIRAAEEKAKREGGNHRRAALMATIATGKVHTVHCGARAAADLKVWVAGLATGVH